MAGHTVAVAFNPALSWDRLAELTPRAHVWLVETPANRRLAKRVWADRPRFDLTSGVTTFVVQPLTDLLGTVDEHHGHSSSNPPYARLEVIGEPLTDVVRADLASIGFGRAEPTVDGFIATR